MRRWIALKRPRLPRVHAVHKKIARALVENRLTHFNAYYGHTYARISIRNQKTRWGSCSTKGTLSFNVRLIFLPPHLIDYIVIHELCHLAQMNHSPLFWSLLVRTCPQYRNCREELRHISLRRTREDDSEHFFATLKSPHL